MVEYKKPFDLELGDKGNYRGKEYILIEIEYSSFDNMILTLTNMKEKVYKVLADEFAVRIGHSLELDKFVELYNEAKMKRLI